MRQTTLPNYRSSYYLSGSLCLVFTLYLMASADKYIHWFILPIYLCGVITGNDAIDWIRKKYNLFSPIGIVGCIGFHILFIAPLLHIHWDYYTYLPTPPSDWRYWFGWMGIINFIGLILYKITINILINKPLRSIKSYWSINNRTFRPIIFFNSHILANTGDRININLTF